MAKHGFTASARAIEAPRGIAQTYSTKCAWNEITDELGERFEISFNTYKPFACGIVIHPSIDGCVQLRNAHGLRAEDIARIDLRVHSLVLELTGKTTPRTGLEAKFSVYHACAAGILFGQAGEHEFSDEIVARADVIALRGRIHAVVGRARSTRPSADVTVTMKDGRTHHLFVEHAIGSLERPMSDDRSRAQVPRPGRSRCSARRAPTSSSPFAESSGARPICARSWRKPRRPRAGPRISACPTPCGRTCAGWRPSKRTCCPHRDAARSIIPPRSYR